MAQLEASSSTPNGISTGTPHVMELLKQFDFLSIGLKGKIHCSLTNRDIPLRVDAIQQHVKSKKLQKEREWYKADFSQYEPLIVAHRTNPKLLYCTLTSIELNRIPKQVEAHVKGKRFLNRKKEMEELEQAHKAAVTPDPDEEFWAPDGGEKSEKQTEEGSDDDDGDGDDPMGAAVDADSGGNAGADEADMDVDEAAASDAKAKHKGKKNRQRQKNGGANHVRAKQSINGGKKGGGSSVEGGSSAEQRLASSRNQEEEKPNAKPEKGTPGKKTKKKGGKKAKKSLHEHTQLGNATPLGDAINGSTNGVSATILNGKSAGKKARVKGRSAGGGENTRSADGKNEASAMEVVDSAVKRKPTVAGETGSSGKKKKRKS